MSKKNNLDEEGLGDIIRERDQRLLDLYKEINNPKDPGRNEQFLKERSKKEIFSGELSNMERTDTYEAQIAGHEQLEIDLNAGRDGTTIFKDDTLKEFNKANQPIQRMYQLGRAVAPEQVDALFELLEGKIGGALRLLPLDKTKGLLREQRDLPKDKTKGLLREQKELTAESSVPLDIIEEFPSIQTIYRTSGLNKEQKGLLKSIFDRVTVGSEEEFVTDPTNANFGALIEDVEEAEGYYGTPPRAFFNKRKVDKRGRMYDLATGEFNVNELGRRYPGAKNKGFRREVQALAVDERFTSTTFVRTRGEIIEDWFDGLEAAKDLYDDPANRRFNLSRDLEAHHIRSIRHMGALMSDMTRAERVRFNKMLWKHGMAVGHNPVNIILLSSSRFNDVHGRLHDKLDEKIGVYAEKMIDKNRRYSYSEKVEIAKRMGQIINRYTFEAYEEMADYLDELMTQADPAAEMAAKIDIAEIEARLDFQLDDLDRRINEQAYASLTKRIRNLPGAISNPDGPYLPYQAEDEDPTEGLYDRLTRGKGKKTIERQERYERLYGKQGELFK